MASAKETMAKNPNRVRIVLMSYQDYSAENRVNNSRVGAIFTGFGQG